MEVLIAFTIAAIVIAALTYGVTVAFRSDMRAKVNRAEMRVAQSRLEAAGIEQPLAVGTLEGESDGLRWRQHVSRAKPMVLAASTNARDSKRPAAELYWVEVVVAGRGGREIRLGASKVVVTAP